ncbi:MAG: hypothetical protein ABSD13_19680 [Candidatus Korobacteraceae bacterium]|jgi:hypothetical protein
MDIPELVVSGVLVVFLLVAIGLLSSRSLTEHLVRRGVLPRFFLELIPFIMLGTRVVAAAMILFGVVRLLAVSGLLSGEWITRYGLASLLILLGLVLLVITFRKRQLP